MRGFALNAANARWGSAYDAFYGTDIIPEGVGTEKGDAYNPQRGELVIARVAEELDDIVPLDGTSHAEATAYRVNREGIGRNARCSNGKRRGWVAETETVCGFSNERVR